MESLKLEVGTFMGSTQKLKSVSGFTLSKTEHDENAMAPKHEHAHPYISLLLHGIYNEQSIVSNHDITSGVSLYRAKGFEHTNEIGMKKSFCFNIEIEQNILNQEYLLKKKDYILFGKNNLEIMKIYYAFQNDFSEELLSLTVEENLYHLFQNQKRELITGRALWVNKLRKQVRFHPEINYSIDYLSELFHIHPVYFSRKFKEVTGYRFSEFLIRQRLAKSIDLMLTSKKNLTHIALECGFYDQSHFIRHFKNIFVVSPSYYRKSMKG